MTAERQWAAARPTAGQVSACGRAVLQQVPFHPFGSDLRSSSGRIKAAPMWREWHLLRLARSRRIVFNTLARNFEAVDSVEGLKSFDRPIRRICD
jgi:hypothetical protein